MQELLALPFQPEARPEGYGLLQRGFFLTTMTWVEVASLWLYRLASRGAS